MWGVGPVAVEGGAVAVHVDVGRARDVAVGVNVRPQGVDGAVAVHVDVGRAGGVGVEVNVRRRGEATGGDVAVRVDRGADCCPVGMDVNVRRCDVDIDMRDVGMACAVGRTRDVAVGVNMRGVGSRRGHGCPPAGQLPLWMC